MEKAATLEPVQVQPVEISTERSQSIRSGEIVEHVRPHNGPGVRSKLRKSFSFRRFKKGAKLADPCPSVGLCNDSKNIVETKGRRSNLKKSLSLKTLYHKLVLVETKGVSIDDDLSIHNRGCVEERSSDEQIIVRESEDRSTTVNSDSSQRDPQRLSPCLKQDPYTTATKCHMDFRSKMTKSVSFSLRPKRSNYIPEIPAINSNRRLGESPQRNLTGDRSVDKKLSYSGGEDVQHQTKKNVHPLELMERKSSMKRLLSSTTRGHSRSRSLVSDDSDTSDPSDTCSNGEYTLREDLIHPSFEQPKLRFRVFPSLQNSSIDHVNHAQRIRPKLMKSYSSTTLGAARNLFEQYHDYGKLDRNDVFAYSSTSGPFLHVEDDRDRVASMHKTDLDALQVRKNSMAIPTFSRNQRTQNYQPHTGIQIHTHWNSNHQAYMVHSKEINAQARSCEMQRRQDVKLPAPSTMPKPNHARSLKRRLYHHGTFKNSTSSDDTSNRIDQGSLVQWTKRPRCLLETQPCAKKFKSFYKGEQNHFQKSPRIHRSQNFCFIREDFGGQPSLRHIMLSFPKEWANVDILNLRQCPGNSKSLREIKTRHPVERVDGTRYKRSSELHWKLRRKESTSRENATLSSFARTPIKDACFQAASCETSERDTQSLLLKSSGRVQFDRHGGATGRIIDRLRSCRHIKSFDTNKPTKNLKMGHGAALPSSGQGGLSIVNTVRTSCHSTGHDEGAHRTSRRNMLSGCQEKCSTIPGTNRSIMVRSESFRHFLSSSNARSVGIKAMTQGVLGIPGQDITCVADRSNVANKRSGYEDNAGTVDGRSLLGCGWNGDSIPDTRRHIMVRSQSCRHIQSTNNDSRRSIRDTKKTHGPVGRTNFDSITSDHHVPTRNEDRTTLTAGCRRNLLCGDWNNGDGIPDIRRNIMVRSQSCRRITDDDSSRSISDKKDMIHGIFRMPCEEKIPINVNCTRLVRRENIPYAQRHIMARSQSCRHIQSTDNNSSSRNVRGKTEMTHSMFRIPCEETISSSGNSINVNCTGLLRQATTGHASRTHVARHSLLNSCQKGDSILDTRRSMLPGCRNGAGIQGTEQSSMVRSRSCRHLFNTDNDRSTGDKKDMTHDMFGMLREHEVDSRTTGNEKPFHNSSSRSLLSGYREADSFPDNRRRISRARSQSCRHIQSSTGRDRRVRDKEKTCGMFRILRQDILSVPEGLRNVHSLKSGCPASIGHEEHTPRTRRTMLSICRESGGTISAGTDDSSNVNSIRSSSHATKIGIEWTLDRRRNGPIISHSHLHRKALIESCKFGDGANPHYSDAGLEILKCQTVHVQQSRRRNTWRRSQSCRNFLKANDNEIIDDSSCDEGTAV